MSKFSVKKPLTVFVAVIAILVLGIVSYTRMTPDLLPNMDFPYVLIMTTYPGANPEKVEAEVTKPLEQSMATLDHIKEITSTSAENYSMVILEFEDGVNLDTIGVDIQQNISSLQGSWNEMISAPYVLKINPSMLPVMVAAVSREGMDNVELTQYLDDGLMQKLEGVPGVARISTSGTIHQELHVVLDQKLIDIANQRIANAINGKMDDALAELNQTKSDLLSAREQMDAGELELEAGKEALTGQLTQGEAEVERQLQQLRDAKTQINSTLPVLKAIQSGLQALETPLNDTRAQLQELQTLRAQLDDIDRRQAEFEAQFQAIRDSGKSQDEIDAEIAALMVSDEYLALLADTAEAENKLLALGITRETLDARITITETALNELQARVDEFTALLAQEGIDISELDAQIATLEDTLAQVEAGITLLEDARQSLSQQKMEGLLALTDAATQLAVNGATVDAALLQIDGGINTLETTREQTLAQTDLSKLLTMEMVSNILIAQNFSMPAGSVTQDGVSYMVSVGEELTSKEEIENLMLFDMGIEGVEPIRMKDVAAVVVTDNRAATYAKLDGLDSVMLTFEKQSTYATAEVTDNILARFQELETEDPNLRFVSLMNQGDYIYMIVEQILGSLIWGAVFAVLILLLFLKDLRPTFITLCSIPISVIFAIVLMYFSGVTINIMSLSGLAVSVGMLVDNSVVVIENIYRLRAKGATVIQSAVSGAKQVAGAVVASTLTTVCVFLPIVFVTGLTRQLFVDLALTMTYSLLASLIVALTLVPAMASGLLRKEKTVKTPLIDRALRGYEKAIRWALKKKVLVIAVTILLLVGSAVWSLSKGFIFMPETDMPNITVTLTMPEGTTMEEAVAISDDALARIGQMEGVATAGATMGGGMSLSALSASGGSYDVTIYVTLADEKASGAAAAQEIEKLCGNLPCEVSATSEFMDMSLLTGSGITMQIYSDNIETLQESAKKAAAILQTVPGVAEVSDGLENTAPALHIHIDRDAAMKQGMTVAQIYMELATALQTQTTVTTLQFDDKSTDVIVEKPAESLLTPETLLDFTFTVTSLTGETSTMRLGDVATVEETMSLSAINRMSQQRYISVSATVDEGVNVTRVTNRAVSAMKSANFADGVTYEFTGENEAIMEAMAQLGLMLLLGVLLVYLVMVAQFQSLKSPFIVMFTIPLAFTGGFMALLICNMEMSIISLIGFIMLTGIIVNNGIVLVDYINQLRSEGVDRTTAIVEAGMTRMRPILMTTITTVLGMLVVALSRDAGNALMRPIAVVCIGGLTYATIMTLFVVPCIYDIMNKKELRVVSDEDLKEVDL